MLSVLWLYSERLWGFMYEMYVYVECCYGLLKDGAKMEWLAIEWHIEWPVGRMVGRDKRLLYRLQIVDS